MFVPVWFVWAITLLIAFWFAVVDDLYMKYWPVSRGVGLVCIQVIATGGIVGLCIKLGGRCEWRFHVPYLALFGCNFVGAAVDYIGVPLAFLKGLEEIDD